MKNFFRILILNILIFSFLLFFIEVSIWIVENETLRRMDNSYRAKGMLKFHSGIKTFKFEPAYFPTPENGWGRAPEGLEFKKKPIVFFGCSYTYGFNLNKEQTLPYKVSKIAKRPTYNRAYPAWGIQHMLCQSKFKEIYEQIPEPEYVIYTFMHDHYRRLYILTFMRSQMLNEDFNLRYKEKNGKLCEIRNINPIFNFVKRLYITNIIYNFYIEHIKLRASNSDEYNAFALKHFVEAKNEMQKYWKNTKYVVFFYDGSDRYLKLHEALRNEGFAVISSSQLVKEDLTSAIYMSNDYHPTEAAWDLLVPKLIEELSL